ncbi:Protein IL-40, partial [Galemys pyrenaicus]
TTPEIAITYKVLEVFPKCRRVLITCHLPQEAPPITYSLWGSQNIEVAKKVVQTQDTASFNINITLKSRADLLTYSCQASSRGRHAVSAKLQMYWELWTKPVSQVQADFTLLGNASAPRVAITCQAASGSPPITYSLVGKDGRIHMQQSPSYGQPAVFSFPVTHTPTWVQCQAANDVGVQSSPPILVPPGKRASCGRSRAAGAPGWAGYLAQGPIVALASSLTSIIAVTCGILGWSAVPR